MGPGRRRGQMSEGSTEAGIRPAIKLRDLRHRKSGESVVEENNEEYGCNSGGGSVLRCL